MYLWPLRYWDTASGAQHFIGSLRWSAANSIWIPRKSPSENKHRKVNFCIVFIPCFIALCIVHDFSLGFLFASLTLSPTFVCYILRFSFEFSEIFFNHVASDSDAICESAELCFTKKVIVKWLSGIAAAAAKLFKSEGRAPGGWLPVGLRGTLPNVKSTQKYIRIVCERVRKFNKLNWRRSCSEPAITVAEYNFEFTFIYSYSWLLHTHTTCSPAAARSFILPVDVEIRNGQKMKIKVWPEQNKNAHGFFTSFIWNAENAVADSVSSNEENVLFFSNEKLLFILLIQIFASFFWQVEVEVINAHSQYFLAMLSLSFSWKLSGKPFFPRSSNFYSPNSVQSDWYRAQNQNANWLSAPHIHSLTMNYA